jgi:hypothetical protein
VTYRTVQQVLAPQDDVAIIVACQGTEVIVGGGFVAAASTVVVYVSAPRAPGGVPSEEWEVRAKSNEVVLLGPDRAVTAYAICAPGP